MGGKEPPTVTARSRTGGGVVLLAAAILLGSCGSDASEADGITVVATTTILGDVAGNVVGDGGTVNVLLPTGADPHEYQPSARQVAAIAEADLVVVNGLGLEEGLADVLESAESDGANILRVAPQLEPIPFGVADRPGSASADPHVWFDPERMTVAAELIAEELTAIDDGGEWGIRATAYAAQLVAADQEIRGLLEVIPPQQRKLITNHDALGYFAARYGFDVIGVVIPGGSTLAEPSSAELTDLVSVVSAEGVPAIFAETTNPAALADAVAAEVDSGVVVVELFTGSLGEPGSGAATLIDMLLVNARRIAGALS
jgi:zinc/manganese transport system substrate-binding protein